MTIPEGYFVVKCDLDAEDPWCEVVLQEDPLSVPPIRLDIPKELAYYLSNHHCGSENMRKMIVDSTRRSIANAIVGALGLDEGSVPHDG